MSLPNALAEVLLLVGIDENVPAATCPLLGDDDDTYYEPKVLSAISGDSMVNFVPVPHRVDSYPPGKITKEEIVRETTVKIQPDSDFENKKSLRKIRSSPSTQRRRLGRMMRLVHSRLGDNNSENLNLRFSADTMHSLPSYCFPDGFKIHKKKPENITRLFSLIDDGSNQRLFISCLTFFRPYKVEKDDIGNAYFTPNLIGEECLSGDEMRRYIPQCCAIVSQYPYHSTLKECLSCLCPHVEKSLTEMTAFIKEFAYVITHTPVPPAGNLRVNFRLYDLDLILLPPTHPDKPVIDLELHLVFLCFNAEEFLKILSCILVEERIVFLSSNYDLLTMFMESLMHLILPFRWKSKYSTVLPSNKIDYLKTPGTFLYGVHSRHTKDVEKMANLVIVDVDNGKVITTDQNLCKREHTKSKGAKRRIQLPNIPTQIANLFVDKMSQVNRKFALSGTLRPNSFKNSEEHNLEIKKRILDQNKCITSICQELIADLFSDVLLNLQPKRRYFDKGSFLEKHVSDKDFYERVFQTKMFETFLEEQMKEKTDYWLEIIRQRDLMSLTTSNEYALSHDETFCEQSTEEELKVLYLENFTKLENHTENIKLQISNKLESLCDCEEKASLYYIRAMFKYSIDENMDALKDFIDMLITNVRIFPIQIVSELYSRLTEEEEEEFMNLPGHKHILYFIKENNKRKEERYRIKMEPLKTPDSDLDFCMLEEIVLLNDMSNNNKTIRELFDALSVVESKSSADEIVHTKVVKQATFWKLKRCWDYNRIQCKKIKLERHILSDEETILKISTGCQTDFGYGRIGLTDRRLFFLNDVTNQYQEIAKLRKIKAIEKVDMNGMFYGVLNGVQALKIITEGIGTNSFTIHFNEERNLLYLVIREMWAGKVVAQAMKDAMMVQHAIQNTLLIDAVIASGHDECSTHFMKSEIVAEKLSYFYELYLNGTHHLSDDTKDALRMKIDVNFGEKDQKTVYSLLYTGGEGNISQPKLWCGLRDGIVKVYNALTWLLDRVIYLEPRNACIACLTPVDKSHVWVGSAGIHIIDVKSLTCTRTIFAHPEQVVDIAVSDDTRSVYTASLDGTIIRWNLQNLAEDRKKINLKTAITSIKIFKDRLICGGFSSLLICDLNATLLKTLTITEDGGVTEISCFHVLENGEVWAGTRHDGKIHVFDISTGHVKHVISIPNCRGISSINVFDDKIWAGLKHGEIYIYSVKDYSIWKQLQGHEDAVKVLYNIRESNNVSHSYMISGAGSRDGRVCIWNATEEML